MLFVRVLLLTVFSFLSVSAGFAQESPTPDQRLQRARAAFHASRFAEVLKESSQVTVASLSSVELLLAKGEISEFFGEFDEAQEAYTKASAMSPNDPAVMYRTASLETRVGHSKQALQLLDRILASHAKLTFIEPIIQLKIDIHLEQGDLESARKLAWAHGIVQRNQGYCAKGQRTPESRPRMKLFRLAILAEPQEGDCFWWFGQGLTDPGFVRMARAMVMESMRVKRSVSIQAVPEDFLKARLSQGRAISKLVEQLSIAGRERYLRENDVDGAVRLLEKAISLDPAYVRPCNDLARIAADQGKHDVAITWLTRATKADPNAWASHRALGKVLAAVERYGEAEVQLRKALTLSGGDVGGRVALGRVLYAQGKFDEYVKETSEALKLAKGFGGHELPGVSAYLEAYKQGKPRQVLPPSPDPPIIAGWKYE
jgi:tetratricopeptide (TPR) repeat protein